MVQQRQEGVQLVQRLLPQPPSASATEVQEGTTSIAGVYPAPGVARTAKMQHTDRSRPTVDDPFLVTTEQLPAASTLRGDKWLPPRWLLHEPADVIQAIVWHGASRRMVP
jgi:hypothetical protein